MFKYLVERWRTAGWEGYPDEIEYRCYDKHEGGGSSVYVPTRRQRVAALYKQGPQPTPGVPVRIGPAQG
jgi:hypothetical protein